MSHRSTSKLRTVTPRRVEILVASGAGYFKKGQFGYVVGSNSKGGMHCQDIGESKPGQIAYLVAKAKHGRGGAIWYSRRGLRFTARKKRRT